MPKFIISTNDAQPSYGGGFSIAIALGGDGPLPDRSVSARKTSEALTIFGQHCSEIAKLGKPLAASIRVARGERAPNGWRKLPQRETLIPVNVPGVR